MAPGILGHILAAIKEHSGSAAGRGGPEVPWTDVFFYEYGMGRYKEIDDLVARARQSGQSLLTWQTALFVGALSVVTRGGFVRFWLQEFSVASLTLLSVVSLLMAIVTSARAALWTEAANIPTSPQAMFEDLCKGGIDKRALCRNLASVYDDSKIFLRRIQTKLRRSLILAAAGIMFFVTLILVLSVTQPMVVDKMFASGK